MTFLITLFTQAVFSCFFFFNDTATTEIYTLSLHDALPISTPHGKLARGATPSRSATSCGSPVPRRCASRSHAAVSIRSEEHTSELQSQSNIVCRLLLEKKK